MRATLGLLLGAVLFLAGLAFYQQQRIALLHAELSVRRREPPRPRQELGTGLSAASRATALPVPAESVSVAASPQVHPSAELLRLRSQVSQLLREKEESAASRAGSGQTGGGVAHPSWAMTDVSFAGYDSPEAVLQSSLWAGKQGDLSGFQACVGGELLQQLTRNSSEAGEQLRQELAREVGEMQNIHLLKREMVDENTTHLMVMIEKNDGKWEPAKLLFTRGAGQWRLSGQAPGNR